jgi:hypothetical protein
MREGNSWGGIKSCRRASGKQIFPAGLFFLIFLFQIG